MGTPVSTLCFKLARIAEDANQPVLAYVLKMAASMALAARLEAPSVPEQFLGTWDWDVANDRVFIDPLAADVFGVDPQDALKGLPLGTFTGAMHAEDVRRVTESITVTARRGGPFSEVYRTDVNGRIRRVLAQGYVTLNAEQRPLRFSGAIFDITDQPTMVARRARSIN